MMEKKDIVKLVITGILALVLVLLLMNSRYAVKNAHDLRKKTLYAPELTLAPAEEVHQQKIKSVGQNVLPVSQNVLSTSQDNSQVGKFTYKQLEEKSTSLKPVRDPFSNVSMSIANKSSSNTISLSGILWDTQKSLALINGAAVKVGDKVGDYVVVSIKQDRVILNNGTQDFELRLGA